MTHFSHGHGSDRAPRPFRAAVLASALVLTGVLGASACSKTVTVSDKSPAPAAAPSSSAAAPSGSGQSAPAGNSGLQVLDSTAAQNGKNGNGGTVVGVAVQETPPVWVQLAAVESPQLGPHLININQATLYRFDKDTASPSVSNCAGACAAAWPPVTIQQGGNVYLAGVDPKKVGAIRRQDGQVQLTVGGQPIYRFAQDKNPGDAKGQGINGTWFAVGPTGAKATP